MKKTLIITALLFLTILMVNADDHEHGPLYQPEQIWKTDFLEVLNSNSQRTILIEFGKYWCNGYKSFAHNTLENEKVKTFLNSRFDLVSLNPNINQKLSERFKVNLLPTYMLINRKGQEIDRIEGYNPPEEFINKIQNIIDSENNFYTLKRKAMYGTISLSEKKELAKKYYSRAMYKKAKYILEYIVKVDEDDVLSNKYLGHIFTLEKNFMKAKYYYDSAIENSKNPENVMYESGYISYMNRMHNRSFLAFKGFIDYVEKNNIKSKYHYGAYYYSILALVFQNRFDEAYLYQKKISDKFPENKKYNGQLRFTIFNAEKAYKENHGIDSEHYHEGCAGATQQ